MRSDGEDDDNDNAPAPRPALPVDGEPDFDVVRVAGQGTILCPVWRVWR